MNPDIYFDKGVLEELYNYMENDLEIGNIMPQILYPNKEIQYLCKLLPTPLDSIFRRFSPFKSFNDKMKNRYEMRFTNYDKTMSVPVLSG